MNTRTSLLALAAIMFAGSAAQAADLAPPPPPAPEIRPAATDWTGPYVGALLGGTCMDTTNTTLDTVENGTDLNNDGDFTDPGESWDGTSTQQLTAGPYDLNGCGIHGGFVAGFNYQIDNMVFGIEGDWTWGGKTGEHNDDNEHDRFDIKWMASIRARLGVLATDKTLFYVTGGAGWLRGEAIDVASGTSFENTHPGYVIGGGVEHALTENLHLRAEYLFSSYKEKTYGTFCAACATDGNSQTAAVDVKEKMENFHTFRAGITWNFPVSTW